MVQGRRSQRRSATVAAALLLLAACAAPPPSATIWDPNEAANRQVHAFNLAADKALVAPFANAYGKGLPEPLRRGVTNFASNLDLPGEVANGLLQVRPDRAVENTLRFVLNTTVGIGGLFDPATAIGLPGKRTDFGETLHVWGLGEGAYVELPLLGPSTERDTAGKVVDLMLNPLSLVLQKPESYVGTVAKFASKLGDRQRFSSTVDSVLYGSADSYAQMRLLYLQKRRFDLGQAVAVEDIEDPYAQ
ncbi:MlaA family lipoprotein [Rhodobacter ferrooxidans]|nr:VacJ family lipoprotein [Rhodobacter sp. SW2]